MVKSVWKSAGSFFKKLNVELPYDPVIPLLCIYKKEKKKKPESTSQKDTCIPMFITALLTIAEKYKNLNVQWWMNR